MQTGTKQQAETAGKTAKGQTIYNHYKLGQAQSYTMKPETQSKARKTNTGNKQLSKPGVGHRM